MSKKQAPAVAQDGPIQKWIIPITIGSDREQFVLTHNNGDMVSGEKLEALLEAYVEHMHLIDSSDDFSAHDYVDWLMESHGYECVPVAEYDTHLDPDQYIEANTKTKHGFTLDEAMGEARAMVEANPNESFCVWQSSNDPEVFCMGLLRLAPAVDATVKALITLSHDALKAGMVRVDQWNDLAEDSRRFNTSKLDQLSNLWA